ncbi:MAG: hypothetical protein GXY82_08095 [Methanospirillum sp.]|nr:hypothetical protein [Methanospirillum sp.]
MIRRLLLILCIGALLVSTAGAYVVTIDAPGTLVVGEPLVVNGSSTLPPGYTHPLVLYLGPAERGRTAIVVQPDGTFSETFETAGLPGGDYRVELERPRDPSFFGSSSTTWRSVTLADRSGEVVVTSPPVQIDSGSLVVSGTATGRAGGSIGIGVTGPGNFTYGPEFVAIGADGQYSATVQVPGPGEYRVALSDAAGLIGRYTVAVREEPTAAASPTVTPTAAASMTTNASETTPVPVSPAPTRASLSPLLAALGAGLLLLVCGRQD